MDYKAEYELLMAMTPKERKLHVRQQQVNSEEYHLQWMVDCNKKDDEFVQFAVSKVRDSMWWHEQDGKEEHLKSAETWAEVAGSFKANRYTIADIRKQRERVQWEKKRLRTMQQNAEPGQSSEVYKS